MTFAVPALREGLEIVRVDSNGRRVYARVLGVAYEFQLRGHGQVEAYVYEDAEPGSLPVKYALNWGLAQYMGLLPDEAVSDLDRALARAGVKS